MIIKEVIEEIGELNKDTNLLQNYVHCLLVKGKALEAVFHYRKAQINGTWEMTNEELRASKSKRTNKRNKEKYGSINDYRNQKPRLLKIQRYSCAECKRKLPGSLLTIDHIISMTDGGTNELDNLQLLCRSCHYEKDKHLIELTLDEQVNEYTLPSVDK